MAAEELIERVLAGDVDRQPAAPPPGPPHICRRLATVPGNVTQIAASSCADVDPQLERVGGDHPEQLARGQLPLDLLALPGV